MSSGTQLQKDSLGALPSSSSFAAVRAPLDPGGIAHLPGGLRGADRKVLGRDDRTGRRLTRPMTLHRAAFERAVRRLDGDDARGFVADLLDARGYRTSVEGPVVTATKETGDGRGARVPNSRATPVDVERTGSTVDAGDPTRLLVVDGLRAVAAVARAPRIDAVVVTGGPLAATVGSIVRGGGPTPDDGPDVVGIDTLYEWFAYAVDAEARAALAATYLDATEPSAFERGWSGLAGAFDRAVTRSGRVPRPSGRSVAVVLLAALALLATATAGPAGLLSSTGEPVDDGGDTPTPRLTAVPTDAAVASGTPASAVVLPEACPPAPRNAHPASLRPGVITTASADGLEGWRLLATQNISQHDFDPNDQRLGLVPEMRHVAVFETQAGVQLRLGLDRWESPARAETAIERGGPWSLAFPWGAYGVWVERRSANERSELASRQLLAAVRTPGGVGLGGACVSELLSASPNGTTTTAAAQGGRRYARTTGPT